MASSFVNLWRCALLGLLVLPFLSAQDLVLPTGTTEIHGRWRTGATLEPFWARLLAPDPAYGGHRVLQVVYQPPAPATLGGTTLLDCPFLLVDGAGRLIAWNERTGHSSAELTAGVYVVQRDRTPDALSSITLVEARVGPAPAWDRTMAPLLLALTWTPAGRATVPVVDLYGGQPASAVAWNRGEVSLAGQACRAFAGPTGTLIRLQDATRGDDLLLIDDRKEVAP